MNKLPFRSSPFISLWLIAAVTALVLSLFSLLETRILAMHQQQTDETLLTAILANVPYNNNLLDAAFLLDPATLVRTDLAGLTEPKTAYIARQQGQPTAVVLPVELAGYNGSIQLLIGITADGEITGVRVVVHDETPRLGDKIELAFSDWVLSFNTRSLNNTDPRLWRVKKEGGEFDQFAGATITPRAVVEAVRNALEFFAANRAVLLNRNSTELPTPAPAGHLIASTGFTAWLAAMTQPLPLLLVGLLLALKNFLARGHSPPSVPPPADIAPGSKRVRVTGKS